MDAGGRMTGTDGPDRLARAAEAVERLVDAVGDDQWGAPTGCPGWTVRDLLAHLVGGTWGAVAALGGPRRPEGDPLGDDPAAALREADEALRGAFARPGVLEQVVTVPAGTVPGAVLLHLRLTELLVHGWDLAEATGRSAGGLPADLAEQELAFSPVQLQRLPPGRSPFGPPQPVGDDAPAVDRLAALLGRPVRSAT